MHDNASAIRRFYGAFAQRMLDDAFPILSDDFEWNDFGFGRRFRGKAGYVENMNIWLDAFPKDGKFEILELNAGDDFAVAECLMTGTMSGPLRYGDTTFEPTERKLSHRVCDVFYFKNGKIVAARTYYDLRALMEQLAVRITKHVA